MALMTKIWTLAEYHQVVDAGVLDRVSEHGGS